MAKYSPVGPIAILEELDKVNLLGDYLLVLAHDVKNNVARYKKLIARKRRHVILDNSSVELGQPMTEGLIELFYEIGADAIVLPDVIGSRDKTLKAIEKYLTEISGFHACQLPWMGIPQGETEDEIIDCALSIQHMLGRNPDYWGVPRWIANKLDSRMNVVLELMDLEYAPRDSDNKAYIHLLGMSENLADDITCCKMSRVAGIDSANPIVLGLKHRDIMNQYSHSPRLETEDHGVHGVEILFDYWREESLTPEAMANIIKLRSVIQ